jgi:hypothetical protein
VHAYPAVCALPGADRRPRIAGESETDNGGDARMDNGGRDCSEPSCNCIADNCEM